MVYLGVPLPAALDKGDKHLRARDPHLELHPRLQWLGEPVKVVPRIRQEGRETLVDSEDASTVLKVLQYWHRHMSWTRCL